MLSAGLNWVGKRLGAAFVILFIGNSHTAFHDVPMMVRQTLGSMKITAETEMVTGGLLHDIAETARAKQMLNSGKYNVVVLQGAGISSSHQYRYSQAGGIALSKRAKQNGARVVLYAEWPRKGWDETEYILGCYREIKKESPAEIAAVGRAWELALSKNSKLALWADDGNHASQSGAFLASQVLARVIADSDAVKPTWVPKGMDAELASDLRSAAFNANVKG